MKKSRTVADLKLNKVTRNAFIKHLSGGISGRQLQAKLKITNTRYYSICRAILMDAVAKGQIKPEELINN